MHRYSLVPRLLNLFNVTRSSARTCNIEELGWAGDEAIVQVYIHTVHYVTEIQRREKRGEEKEEIGERA